MGKLKSSMKSIQNSFTRFKPAAPSCIQEAKTHSFREEDASHYHSSLLPSSSSSLTPSIPKNRAHARFFFSPRNTSSIMEERKEISRDPAAISGSFLEQSKAIVLVSKDPYRDFKASMEEMTTAHELKDWRRLHELLHCYLRLNERKSHNIIVLAFVDLLMNIKDLDR